ncbi:MAG TPA: anti-sigma factor [Marmoricola sp.]|nr:anti-sigma factor [Marmoricola sp.]
MSSEIHALSGAYAVDALDGQEREAFERHLAGCSACQAEVDSLHEAATSLVDAVALTPPAHLRDAVLDDIAKVRPLPPLIPIGQRRPNRIRWISGSLVLAAAIALFVAFSVRPTSNPHQNLSAAAQIVHADDAITVNQHLANGAIVVWYRSARLDGAAVSIKDLPTAASGKTYELWLQTSNGVMHPAGLIRGGTTLVTLRGSGRSAVGAGLTVEPTGGSTKPTLPAVTVASFAGA